MDVLTSVNAGLAGLFAFAAIHYAVTWWFSRKESVLLLFSVLCAIYVAVSLVIASYFRSSTVSDAQTTLNWIVTFGAVTHGVVLHYYAVLDNRRDRWFRLAVTGAMVFLAVLSQLMPMRGFVTQLQSASLPWGGTGLLPILTPPGAPLVLLYLGVFAIHGYGLFIASRIWKRDRGGGVLIAIAAATILAGAMIGFLIDFAEVLAPYVGALPHAIFVVLMALYLSREYASRGVRLAAKRSLLALYLSETQKALADLEAEHQLLEESEAARLRAMEALTQAQRKELASHLAASVAHDFANILCLIQLWSNDLLEDHVTPEVKETARKALEDANTQGLALSRQLMALARPGSRSVKRFPLDRPIRLTELALTAMLPRGIRLECDAPEDLEIEADETEIQQVIYNLILNARDAMPDGGSIHVTGGIETSSIPIAVVGGSLEPGRWATLSVTDSGPGVDPTIRDQIFDLFFTTKGQNGGTGIGLATVFRIAKANGGGVTLENTEGSGATFKLYFPVI